MALDVWPSSLPKFDANSYSLELQDNLLRTQMDSGRTRVRRTSTFTPTRLSCNWIMTHAELRTFREFYHTTISDGTESFTMPVYAAALGADTAGYKDHEVRFTAPYGATYRTANTWVVTGQLDVLDDIPNV